MAESESVAWSLEEAFSDFVPFSALTEAKTFGSSELKPSFWTMCSAATTERHGRIDTYETAMISVGLFGGVALIGNRDFELLLWFSADLHFDLFDDLIDGVFLGRRVVNFDDPDPNLFG